MRVEPRPAGPRRVLGPRTREAARRPGRIPRRADPRGPWRGDRALARGAESMAILPPESRGERMDRAIHRMLCSDGRTVSVREVRAAIRRGTITVNERRVAPGHSVAGGEAVDFSEFIARSEADIAPAPTLDAVRVLAEDKDLLVLDKPAGMPTLPLVAGEEGTLVNVAVAVAPAVGQAGPPLEGGLVHRLDTGTSGVVVFAKTEQARRSLRAAFAAHAVDKRYLALTVLPTWREARAEGRIAGHGRRVRVLAPDAAGGLCACTDAQVVVRGASTAWVQADTRTGRRHQIRAHLSHLEAPLVGDPLYGGPEGPRLGLHASEIRLPDGRYFRAPLPAELTELLESP